MSKKQLTVRGLIIGMIGSVVLTMSSMFIALKLSSVPWPIMFVVLVSMFLLKLCGNTNLQEINVTQTAMSAGAMVAGGLVGAVVSVCILFVILKAYGPSAFGSEMFPAAQASAVAAMVGGISNMPAFVIGLIVAAVLYCVNFPVITLGLGVYLPFYMSATAAIGGALRLVADKLVPKFEADGKGTVIAAGLLGGESIVGVIIAIYYAYQIIS